MMYDPIHRTISSTATPFGTILIHVLSLLLYYTGIVTKILLTTSDNSFKMHESAVDQQFHGCIEVERSLVNMASCHLQNFQTLTRKKSVGLYIDVFPVSLESVDIKLIYFRKNTVIKSHY